MRKKLSLKLKSFQQTTCPLCCGHSCPGVPLPAQLSWVRALRALRGVLTSNAALLMLSAKTPVVHGVTPLSQAGDSQAMEKRLPLHCSLKPSLLRSVIPGPVASASAWELVRNGDSQALPPPP